MKRNDPKYIILHCSASPAGRGDGAEEIDLWHTTRGFDGIGYHEVILEDGTMEPGRPWFWPGAHCKKFNKKSLGLCRIGVGDDASAQQIEGIVKRINILRHRFGIPIANVIGHYEVEGVQKTCPDIDMDYIRKLLVGSLRDFV